MNNLIIVIFTLILSLAILIKAADYFTDYALKIGQAWGFSDFLVGVLLIAVGTSLPELSTSLIAAAGGQTEMLASNVFGSVIANFLLGFAVISIFTWRHYQAQKSIFEVDFPIFMGGLLVLGLIIYDGTLTAPEGIVLLILGVIYLYHLYQESTNKILENTTKTKWWWFIIVILALIGILESANLVVSQIIKLATMLNYDTGALTASIVALGTSLPEMIVAISAVKIGKFDLALGNILGSNIFNILFIFGLGGIMTPIIMGQLTLSILFPFTLVSSVLFWIIFHDGHLAITEGLMMLTIYLLFLGKIFGFI